jgi:hypothetical protein
MLVGARKHGECQRYIKQIMVDRVERELLEFCGPSALGNTRASWYLNGCELRSRYIAQSSAPIRL